MKNFEDATLFGRADMYAKEWNIGCLRLWGRIDALLREAHYPQPPMPLLASPQPEPAE